MLGKQRVTVGVLDCGAVWPCSPQTSFGCAWSPAPHCNHMPTFSELIQIGAFRFHIPSLPMNFFGFLTLVSLIPKAFQTLLAKHLFPTENLFSISGPPEHIIGIPSPVHCLTLFPCLPSSLYSPSRPCPYCIHSGRPSRRPLHN